ncbi:hypothetical protein BGZ99_009073 [Dissophora globulifera]|uniref:Uncharacterized protein n=1 Tax=Dissophora globulifera TaxID=979702 RepID=A0A9P6RAE2_9FUNG|nr:hypothetical protein BGZ99_009073 [Dissophora globulifera]
MIKGREQADIITTVISVKIAYAIPLIVIALLSLVVYSYINLNLLLNSKNLLSYKLHVNARDYLPNLYDNKFTVDTVKNDREVLDNLRENPKILGPIFEHGQEGLENIKLL